METKHWVIHEGDSLLHHPAIRAAARLIEQGETVAFPTETVYGLGANALSDEAVQQIFAAKGRPSDNPLIIHLHAQEQIKELVTEIPPQAQMLFNAFAPGPLTVVMNSNGKISKLATAGLESIGIRIPNHPVALALLKETNLPLAAPSANASGRPSPTLAEHVLEDLMGRISGVLDAGETGVGVESTVIDITVTPPMILRPGGITREQIEAIIGPVNIDPALVQTETMAPRSPGMKYTHYAPKAPLHLVEASSLEQMRRTILDEAKKYMEAGKQVGILTTEEAVPYYQDIDKDSHQLIIRACGKRTDLSTVAQELYQTLRSFDHTRVSIILGESFPYEGIGTAIMNRLYKAAGGQVIKGK